jgi:hypothetical protein
MLMQNRLIGSIRRECIDLVVVFGERHLRHVLLSYKDYYNGTRTHLSLNKDAPISRSLAVGTGGGFTSRDQAVRSHLDAPTHRPIR